VTNTPVLNGKDSPIPKIKGLHEFSSYEKSCLSKYGYINQAVLETETGLSPSIGDNISGMSTSLIKKDEIFSPLKSLQIDSSCILTPPLTVEKKNVERALEFADSENKSFNFERNSLPSHFKRNRESVQLN
jgi:hypothetical protein